MRKIITIFKEQLTTKDLFAWFFVLVGIALCLTTTGAIFEGFNSMHDSGNQYSYFGRDDVRGIRNFMIRVFKSGWVAVFIVALFLALVSVIRLLVSENSDEDFKKWRNSLIWSLAGLFLISIAYYVVDIFDVDSGVGNVGRVVVYDGQTTALIMDTIVYPLISFLWYVAVFFFIFAIIYGFYRMVASAGDEGGIKQWRRTFFNAILGFILVLIAEPFVSLIYSGDSCRVAVFGSIKTECQNRSLDTLALMGIFTKIIIFLNGLVALVTLIFILYAGFLVLTSGGNEAQVTKARKIIIYAIIGIVLLVFSYLIFKFILYQE